MERFNTRLQPRQAKVLARLRDLGDEIATLATKIQDEEIEVVDAPPGIEKPSPESAEFTAGKRNRLRDIIRARRLRSQFIPEGQFADPAWDILLDLFQAELGQVRMSVSTLCVGAGVPATTALRWIASMTERGILVRKDDPYDGRRFYVELAPQTSRALDDYFESLSRMGGLLTI